MTVNHPSSPELPDVIDSKVAVNSLREHTATLVKAFRHCLSSLADSLYSQSIIPEDAHRKALNKYLDEDERSRALVSCVEARLEVEPSDFKKFVDVLKSEPYLGTLGSQLVQRYYTATCPSVTLSPDTRTKVAPDSSAHSMTTENLKTATVLRKLMPLAGSWKNIGVFLEVPDSELDTIEANYPRVQDCLREMIRTWLKMVDPVPTWERLWEAVKGVSPNGENDKIAQEIHSQFLKK